MNRPRILTASSTAKNSSDFVSNSTSDAPNCGQKAIESAKDGDNIRTRDVRPESSAESALNVERRNFLKNALLVTSGAAIGGTVLANAGKVLPESSASSAAYNYSNLYVSCSIGIGTCNPASCTALCVQARGGNIHASGSVVAGADIKPDDSDTNSGSLHPGLAFGSSGTSGISSALAMGSSNLNGLDFYTCNTKRMSIGSCGKVAIGTLPDPYVGLYIAAAGCCTAFFGSAERGAGVSGTSCCVGIVGVGKGIAVLGYAGSPSAVPIVAGGYMCQNANLQEWQLNCVAVSVVNQKGWLGIGTELPSSAICSVSSSSTAINGNSTAPGLYGVYGQGVGAGVSGISKSVGGAGVQALSGNTCSIPIIARGDSGQKANLMEFQNNCKAVLSVVNKSGWVGIASGTPSTTLQVGGSLSLKTVVASGNYKMGPTDFAVLATGKIKVTLPPASTAAGMIVFVKNDSTKSVTIEAFSNTSETDTIEGAVSKSLNKQYDSLQLISNGSNEWFVLGNSICAAFTS